MHSNDDTRSISSAIAALDIAEESRDVATNTKRGPEQVGSAAELVPDQQGEELQRHTSQLAMAMGGGTRSIQAHNKCNHVIQICTYAKMHTIASDVL